MSSAPEPVEACGPEDYRIDRTEVRRGWQVEWRSGPAGALHHARVASDIGPSVWVCRPDRVAVVCGSTQRDLERELRRRHDPGRSGAGEVEVEVVRRRSGGGAVLVHPSETVWVDLVVPAGHHLWDPDVGRAMHWVGRAWASMLGTFGVSGRVHTSALERSEWSDLVCFAGVGPGEVVDRAGHKLVGISQRRSRDAARFQTMAYLDLEPAALVPLLGVGIDAAEVEMVMRHRSGSLGRLGRSLVVERLLGLLPSA